VAGVQKVAAGVPLLLSLSACVPLGGEPFPPLAIAVEDSRVEVILTRCGELIREVSVRQLGPSQGGPSSERLLWAARVDDGEGVVGLTIGEAPVGFRTGTTLQESLPQDGQLVISVVTSFDTDISKGVVLSQLQAGEVLYRGEAVPREEFEDQRSEC
jgi:hypothetical protein